MKTTQKKTRKFNYRRRRAGTCSSRSKTRRWRRQPEDMPVGAFGRCRNAVYVAETLARQLRPVQLRADALAAAKQPSNPSYEACIGHIVQLFSRLERQGYLLSGR